MKIACNKLYTLAKDFAKNANLAGKLRFFQRDDSYINNWFFYKCSRIITQVNHLYLFHLLS